jgi:hypothetical protein
MAAKNFFNGLVLPEELNSFTVKSVSYEDVLQIIYLGTILP